MKKLLWLAAPLVLAVGVMTGGMSGFAASSAQPPAPPGQGDCAHGNTGKPCKPDPQPEHGKDCDIHGNNGVGGVNEDHCLATTPTTTTDETTTNQTTRDETTTSVTTTTDKTATEQSTTTSQTSTTATAGPTTSAGPSNGTPSASSPSVTKPQLQGELAQQAAKAATGRVAPERSAAGQLPFTGFPGWILALLGSAMLVAGFGLRRLAA